MIDGRGVRILSENVKIFGDTVIEVVYFTCFSVWLVSACNEGGEISKKHTWCETRKLGGDMFYPRVMLYIKKWREVGRYIYINIYLA